MDACRRAVEKVRQGQRVPRQEVPQARPQIVDEVCFPLPLVPIRSPLTIHNRFSSVIDDHGDANSFATSVGLFFSSSSSTNQSQLCSGMDENAVGVCYHLVFAPIGELFPDDAPLLPSGFRVILLDAKSVKYMTT